MTIVLESWVYDFSGARIEVFLHFLGMFYGLDW